MGLEFGRCTELSLLCFWSTREEERRRGGLRQLVLFHSACYTTMFTQGGQHLAVPIEKRVNNDDEFRS